MTRLRGAGVDSTLEGIFAGDELFRLEKTGTCTQSSDFRKSKKNGKGQNWVSGLEASRRYYYV